MLYKSEHTGAIMISRLQDGEEFELFGQMGGICYCPKERDKPNGEYYFYTSFWPRNVKYLPVEKFTVGGIRLNHNAGKLFFTKTTGKLVIMVGTEIKGGLTECYLLNDPIKEEYLGEMNKYSANCLEPAPPDFKFEFINPFYQR
jgi:hypothetical protein